MSPLEDPNRRRREGRAITSPGARETDVLKRKNPVLEEVHRALDCDRQLGGGALPV